MEKLKLNYEYIRKRKFDLWLNNVDLARKMEVKPQWLSQLFRRAAEGKGVNLATLAKLAEALECEQKDLLI
jgi:DNA-binding Xre family transcriptional regulator